jgi:hypothetical protein
MKKISKKNKVGLFSWSFLPFNRERHGAVGGRGRRTRLGAELFGSAIRRCDRRTLRSADSIFVRDVPLAVLLRRRRDESFIRTRDSVPPEDKNDRTDS